MTLSAETYARVRNLFDGKSDGIMPETYAMDQVIREEMPHLTPTQRIAKKRGAEVTCLQAQREMRERMQAASDRPKPTATINHVSNIQAGGYVSQIGQQQVRQPQPSSARMFGYGTQIETLSDRLERERPGPGMHISASGSIIDSAAVDRELQYYRTWPPEGPNGTLSEWQVQRVMAAIDPNHRDPIRRKHFLINLEQCGRVPAGTVKP